MSRVIRKQPAERVVPRFDFESVRELATIRDLLKEINDEINARLQEIHDQNKRQGVREESAIDVPEITFRSMAKTLKFVEEISGLAIKSEGEEVDIRTLKAIKLLFKKSDKRVDGSGERKNSRNIFSLLQRPKEPEKDSGKSTRSKKQSGRATMESCTGTTISRDPLGEALIGEIVSTLSMGIEPEKLAMIEAVLQAPRLYGPAQAEALSGARLALGCAVDDQTGVKKAQETRSDAQKLQDHIALGTLAVEDLLFRAFGTDDLRLASAYRKITKELTRYQVREFDRPDVPAHEALYVHARTLGLQHFIVHHRAFLAEIGTTKSINDIDEDVWLLCMELGGKNGAFFEPTDYVVPLASFEVFVQPFLSWLMALVELATGLATPEAEYERNARRARKILRWAVNRRYDLDPPEPAYVCMLDAVAALCSVRYQQEQKFKYTPYWESQLSQGSSPERMLDAFEYGAETEFGLHQGVFLLYHNHYTDYLAAFTGTGESNNAFAEFELCRFDGYLAAMHSKSLMEFHEATVGFNTFGYILALDIVYESFGHGRPG